MREPTIFELSSTGRTGVTFQEPDVPLTELPQEFARVNRSEERRVGKEWRSRWVPYH